MESEKPQDTIFVKITDITGKKEGEVVFVKDLPETIVRDGLEYHLNDYRAMLNRAVYELK